MSSTPDPSRSFSPDGGGDDELLSPLAARIADGESVDWEGEREHLGASDLATLDALREIAEIESAHRSAQHAYGSPDEPAPRQWRNLTILEEIGVGRFGRVCRAFDNALQIEVALKLSDLEPSTAFDASRVLREARQLAKVHHPNVVRVHGADYYDGRAGIWMDLVRGRTLEAMSKEQRFGADEATNVGIQLARAMAAAHGEGVLHGDIKPHNVVRRDNGDFVLIDFGASERLNEQGNASAAVVGTLVYMAPEVLRGEPRSRASDIYALGVLLFKLVTDSYPVFATSVEEAVDAHRNGTRQHLRDLRPDLPASFVQVVERATASEPAERFATAAALEAALIHRELPAPSGSSTGRLRWLAGVALVAALGGGVWTLWRTSNGDAPTAAIAASSTVPTREVSGANGPAGAAAAAPLTIDAAFYRVGTSGPERLDASKAFHLDDEFYLTARVNTPTHLYVVDEDEFGKAYLLFPLPDDSQTNPIPPAQNVKIPSAFNWSVDSAGGREHLVVFASTAPLAAFEDAFRRLPAPRVGEPGDGPRLLPDSVLEHLRGVGRLTKAATPAPEARPTFWKIFDRPLNGPETAPVPWVRQLTVASPVQ